MWSAALSASGDLNCSRPQIANWHLPQLEALMGIFAADRIE